MNNTSTLINKCPISGTPKFKEFLNLGQFPLVNNLYDSKLESLTCDRYPLILRRWNLSKLVSLSHVINPDLLFKYYTYKSGVNKPYVEHCEELFNLSTEYIKYTENCLVVDIGGNDNTLLKKFVSKTDGKCTYLNVDPSDVALVNKPFNINVYSDYFNDVVATNIVSVYKKKASIITSTNVFQHLRDIDNFVAGINTLLDINGIWILEFPYWVDSVNTLQFDQIYHEHVYYYTVSALNLLLVKHNLSIIDILHNDIHGGSLTVVISHCISSKHKPNKDNIVTKYLNIESSNENYMMNVWPLKVSNHIKECSEYIKVLSTSNKIYGFGAAAKGCIFLNAMGINYSHIEYVIDDTDIKQNKFIPGTGIQVCKREILNSIQPDYILILAHNFKDYIIKSLKDFGYTGKFIILVPNIKIIH